MTEMSLPQAIFMRTLRINVNGTQFFRLVMIVRFETRRVDLWASIPFHASR